MSNWPARSTPLVRHYRIEWSRVFVYLGLLGFCLGFWFGVYELGKRVL